MSAKGNLPITEESYLELQRQLIQAQKMEALGQLSSRVAHDLNNALGVIRGHLQMLERLRENPDKFARSLKLAISGCDLGESLVDELLQFGKPSDGTILKSSPRSLALLSIDFAGSLMGKSHELKLAEGGEDCLVAVDENQILQVFTNLYINAMHAMPRGGAIVLNFGTTRLSAPSKFNTETGPGEYALIMVQDTGTGVAPENIEKIFEPFFSTKSPGQGTGLGLSICRAIMAQHKGWIEVQSELGKGTVFTIGLPIVG